MEQLLIVLTVFLLLSFLVSRGGSGTGGG